MGDIKWVAKKMFNHIRHNVKSKPHLSFDNNIQVPLTRLSSIYILGDGSNTNTCFVGAHGGNYSADYVFDTKEFDVPANVTVEFTQPAGYSMGMQMSALRTGMPFVETNFGQVTYNAGDSCPNYFLSKWHGRHSGDPNYAANEEDYAGWQAIVRDTGYVFVFPRNRWYHTGVTLKSVISDVRGEFPGIDTFVCLFCRVDDTTAQGDPIWDAQNGSWV